MSWDIFSTSEDLARSERAAARELRRSRWWQNKIAANAQCYYCGVKLTARDATMDHMVPISQGGRSTRGNVVIACLMCNRSKKDHDPIASALANTHKI